MNYLYLILVIAISFSSLYSDNLKNDDNAINEIAKLAIEFKNNPTFLYNLALTYKAEGKNDKALEYFLKSLGGKYNDEAIAEIKQFADAGDKDAQFNLANIYRLGVDINENIDKALEYYELAAKQEDLNSFNYIRFLARKGYPQAEYLMGYFYLNGINLEEDATQAIEWYKRAIKQHHKEAIKELIIANEKHTSSIYLSLGMAYKDGSDEEKKEAFKYFKKSAKLDNKHALVNLGACYEYGVGVPKNFKKAFQYYLEGANKGADVGQLNIARAYKDGRGVKKDLEKSLYWLEKSAEQNNTDAIVDLAIAYESGFGTDIDITKAISLYKKAMGDENLYAMFKIASFYEIGVEGLKKNPQKAFNIYKRAAFLGDESSLEVMAEYREAAKKGNREAKILIDNSD